MNTKVVTPVHVATDELAEFLHLAGALDVNTFADGIEIPQSAFVEAVVTHKENGLTWPTNSRDFLIWVVNSYCSPVKEDEYLTFSL